MTNFECIKMLIDQVQELKPTYDEHIRDNDVLLPHLFLGDVVRYFVEQVNNGSIKSDSSILRILNFVEQCLNMKDDQINELIYASFFENIMEYRDVISRVKVFMGPNTIFCFSDVERDMGFSPDPGA